jgi:hypothetical protein
MKQIGPQSNMEESSYNYYFCKFSTHLFFRVTHCKKELAVFPSPAGMSLIKLFLGGNNLFFSRPERVWSVTSRLGTGKWLTLFYSAIYPADLPYNNNRDQNFSSKILF